jgi:hypothetical protein
MRPPPTLPLSFGFPAQQPLSLSLPPLSPRGALGFGDGDRRSWIPGGEFFPSPSLLLSLPLPPLLFPARALPLSPARVPLPVAALALLTLRVAACPSGARPRPSLLGPGATPPRPPSRQRSPPPWPPARCPPLPLPRRGDARPYHSPVTAALAPAPSPRRRPHLPLPATAHPAPACSARPLLASRRGSLAPGAAARPPRCGPLPPARGPGPYARRHGPRRGSRGLGAAWRPPRLPLTRSRVRNPTRVVIILGF